jgi:virginiamycin B lyase
VRLGALTFAVTVLIAASAYAAPAVDGVFDIPGDAGVTTNGQLTVGPDGNIWVVLDTAIAKVTPDGTVTVLGTADLNNTLGSPAGGITSAGGFIWVSQGTGGGKKPIVKIPPASPGAAEGTDVTNLTAGATAMTTGSDGNIWVGIADKLIRFSPANPATSTTYTGGFTGLAPKAITSASDGTLWVTDGGSGGRLVNVTTAGVPTPVSAPNQPQFIAAGPNGQVAFSNSNPQEVGLLSPGGSPQSLNRTGGDPFGLTFGSDGAYWVAEFGGNRLARVTTDGQVTTLTGFPDAPQGTQGPRQIVAGPNNTLWTTIDKPGDAPNSKIARITDVTLPVVTPPPTGELPPPEQSPTTNPPPPDKAPPAITNISLAKTSARVRLMFTMSEQATLKIDLSRAARGQRHGKSCLKPNARRKKAKRCTRWLRVRALGGNGSAGLNTIQLNTRKLRKGRYRVVFSATDAAGNRSAPVTRTFRVGS